MRAVPQTQPHAALPPRSARRAVTLCFASSGALLATWIVRIPDIQAHAALTDGQLGIALAGVSAGAIVGQIVVGRMLARHGSRTIGMRLALATCALLPLAGIAPNWLSLLLSLLLFGGCAGGMDVAVNAQAALIERAYARPLMVRFHAAWSIAGLLGAVVGGYLAGQGTPVALHFLAVAAVVLLVISLARHGLLDEPLPATAAPRALRLPPRRLLPLGVLAFCVFVCEGAVGDWSAIYLRESVGSSPGVAALGYGVFACVMTLGRLAGDWLTVRVGAVQLVRGEALLIVGSVALLQLSVALPAALLGFGLMGAALACPFPIVISAAARTPQVAAGTAIAAMSAAGYAGSLLGPVIIGAVAEMLSVRSALGLLGVAGVLMLLVSGAVQQRSTV